jgi:hypothetical protein
VRAVEAAVFNFYNIVAYQIVWFACVLGAAQDVAWLGTVVALRALAAHLWFIEDRHAELTLMAAAAVVGLIVDTALIRWHVISFNAGLLSAGFPPHWMLSLWLVFATTLNHSLRWLARRPALAAICGGIGGPLAYYAGMRLGALQIQLTPAALLTIGAAWALAMAALALLASLPGLLHWNKRCARSSSYLPQ